MSTQRFLNNNINNYDAVVSKKNIVAFNIPICIYPQKPQLSILFLIMLTVLLEIYAMYNQEETLFYLYTLT